MLGGNDEMAPAENDEVAPAGKGKMPSVVNDVAAPESHEMALTESSTGALKAPALPCFHCDEEVFEQYQKFLQAKNHHGLALLARQKGVPPFLRFKVWPVLLKHHPFVASPFIQPDHFDKDKPSSDSESEEAEKQLQHKIRKDLRKYMHRIAYSSSEEPLLQTELQLFDLLEHSVLKFVNKWGRIIKYDQALTWIAMGLAEWFPPIPHTPWVLLGRDVSSKEHSCIGSVFDGYDEYIESVPGLRDLLQQLLDDDNISSLTFHEAFERLALVLLHSPEVANQRKSHKSMVFDKSTLPVTGGLIEERVSFFIYVFQKLLPELYVYFQEEQILNKFGLYDDEWVLWWLKYCGAKVWSRVDRGRVWDLILGWRAESRKVELDHNYYTGKINIPDAVLDKLGPDAFWSVDDDDDTVHEFLALHESSPEGVCRQECPPDSTSEGDRRQDSTSNSASEGVSRQDSTPESLASDSPNGVLGHSMVDQDKSVGLHESLVSLDTCLAESEGSTKVKRMIPFAIIDPHIELVFVSLSLLKAKEHTLVELDQHEIRTFLSRLPAKLFKLSDRYKKYQEQKDKMKGALPASENRLTYEYMDSIIYEAGELWRKWLWLEMSGES